MENIPFALVDADGRIVMLGSVAPYDIPLQATEGTTVVVGQFDPATTYRSGEEMVERPAIAFIKTEIAADGVDAVWVDEHLPGTKVYLNGVFLGTVDGEAFSFVAEDPGTYELRLEPPFPHQVLTGTVTAT